MAITTLIQREPDARPPTAPTAGSGGRHAARAGDPRPRSGPAHRLGRAQPRRRHRQRRPRVPPRPVRGRRDDLAAVPRLAAGDRRDRRAASAWWCSRRCRRHLGTAAAHAYGGYLAHLTAWAEANKIPYQGVPVGTIKRHIAGKGNADKAAVIAAVRKLGFAPADDNEADALALLDWAIAQGIGGAR